MLLKRKYNITPAVIPPVASTFFSSIKAFWHFGDAFNSPTLADSTGRGNNLSPYLRVNLSTDDLCIGQNRSLSYYDPQCSWGALKGFGKWHRLLSATEKAALYAKEYHPFNMTTSLRDAKTYYLLDEVSASATYADATGRGNTLTGIGTTTRVTGPTGTDNATEFYTVAKIATITASIAGRVLTVTAASGITIAVGQLLMLDVIGYFGSRTLIESFGTGSGGNGTYNLSAISSTTISSRSMELYPDIRLSKVSPGVDIQSGSTSITLACWVKLNRKPTFIGGGNQQVFWGQLGSLGSGFNLYYDPTADRFLADLDGGDYTSLNVGVFIVDSTVTSPVLDTWYFLLAEYDTINNRGTFAVNNGVPNIVNNIMQPIPVPAKIGNGSQFYSNPQGSFSTKTSGWDVQGGSPVAGNSNAALYIQSADVSFGNNSKTVWGWFKASDFTTYQTLGGIYDGTAAGTDWTMRISASLLYFVFGYEASYITVPMADTNWHFFVAWFDKAANRLHLVMDNTVIATPVIGAATPQITTNKFLVGADKSGFNGNQFTGILNAWGVADGNPTQADLDKLWNNGSGWTL